MLDAEVVVNSGIDFGNPVGGKCTYIDRNRN